MAGIFTRKALADILNDEKLSPEERTEQIYSLYGRSVDDGFVSKSAAKLAQASAIEQAKAEWEKSAQKPDIKESDEYKALSNEFASYKAMNEARNSEAYKDVKGKFFETVYGMIDQSKDVPEQLAQIRTKYEEYFNPADGEKPKNTPQFSQRPGHPGTNNASEEDKLYKQLSDAWK